MPSRTYYQARVAPFAYSYVVSKGGEPAYEVSVEGGDLVFRDADGAEVFRVEDRFFSVEEGYHVVDAESGDVVGRLVDEIALFGSRWSILDADGAKVATVRDKGKFGALVREVGLATTLPLPISMEVVLSSGQPVGAVRRGVGLENTISLELDSDPGFDERLALGAALMLDWDDRLERDISRRYDGE